MQRIGRYDVVSRLGQGAFGEVLRARLEGPMGFRKDVALKRLHAHLEAGGEEWLSALLNEARLGGALTHPNIVQIYELFQHQGAWHVAMEYVRGSTLAQIIERCQVAGILLLPSFAVEAGLEICRALQYAFAAAVDDQGRPLHIIHRDLKPANLMLTESGSLKVLDFGLARAAFSPVRSSSGSIKGTPVYMSPEQARGGRLGPTSDLYSLGLVVYELVMCRRLISGDNLSAILHRIEESDFSAELPELDRRQPGLSAIVGRCLARDPEARWRNAEELGAALAQLRAPGASALGAGAQAVFQGPDAPEGLASPFQEFARRFHAPDPSPWRPLGPASSSASESAVADTHSPGVAAAEDRAHGNPGPMDVRGPGGSSTRTSLSPKTRRRGAWIQLSLVTLAAGSLALWALHERSRAPPPALSVPSASEASHALLEPLREIVLPVDAVGVVSEREDHTLIVAGSAGVYLVPSDGTGTAASLALGSGESVISGAEGRTWTVEVSGSTSVIKERGFAPASERILFSGVPVPLPRSAGGAPAVVASRTGRTFAVVGSKALEVFRSGPGRPGPALRVPCGDFTCGSVPVVAVGDRMLALSAPGRGELAFYSLESGKRLGAVPLRERQVHSLALQEETGLVAVGGWFDRVFVFRIGDAAPLAEIARRGETFGLEWIPDAPTLLIAGTGGAMAWRPGKGLVATLERPEATFSSIQFVGAAVAFVDPNRHRAALYSYRGAAELKVQQVSPRELWAMGEDPSRHVVFVAGSDGVLYEVPNEGKPVPHVLHSEGVTSMVVANDRLATSSDDKTIAVWKLPALTVEWRSKGHALLINQLRLVGPAPALWSSSSDGSVKKWRWPALDEEETVSPEQLLHHRYRLHSFWLSPDERQVLAGTWDHALLVFHRTATGWSAEERKVASQVLYSMAAVPAVEAVVMVGLSPSTVQAFDLRTGVLEELDSLGMEVVAAAPGPDGSTATVVGNGSVLHYRFARGAHGELTAEVAGCVDTRFGDLMTAVERPSGELLAGNDLGQLLTARCPAFRPLARTGAQAREAGKASADHQLPDGVGDQHW